MAVSIVYSRPFLLLASLAVASVYSIYHYKKIFGKKPKKEIHEVILFSYKEGKFKQSKYSRCKITNSMDRLLHYINSARFSLDICVYVITNLDLATAVMKLHYRGVKIRILIDADMAYSQGSCIRKMEKHGISTRWIKSPNLMHHKFFLIDASTDDPSAIPLVVNGSLNWTNQALYGNWENVSVTSQPILVSQYKAAFEELWSEFKPVVGF